jgi:hypothetical protein
MKNFENEKETELKEILKNQRKQAKSRKNWKEQKS